jgi:hypothetical protein
VTYGNVTKSAYQNAGSPASTLTWTTLDTASNFVATAIEILPLGAGGAVALAGSSAGVATTTSDLALNSYPTIVETVGASISGSRSPAVTFTNQPQVGDLVIMWPSEAAVPTLTIPSGWVNVLGGTTQASTTSLAQQCIFHVVVAADVSGNVKTYTATNLFASVATGYVTGVLVRNINQVNPLEKAQSQIGSSASTTHVLSGLTSTNVPATTDDLVLSSVSSAGTGAYSPVPSGWGQLAATITNLSHWTGYNFAYTTATTSVAATNITNGASSRYTSITVALRPGPTGIVASAAGTSTVTSDLTVTHVGGGPVALAGSSAGVSTVTSAVAVARALVGSSAGVATAVGTLGPSTNKFIVSISGTKILDQNGQPYWIQGCSPQLMAVKGLHTDFDAYFSAVAALGYNAAQVMAMDNQANLGNVGGVNANGDAPFTNMTNFTGPVTAYWNLLDDLVATAAGYGITVFLGILDNIAYGATVASLSSTDATNFGTFLGNRYKTATNIVWIVGNDYLSSQWSGRDANYKHIMDAIAAASDAHIMTLWLDSPPSTNGTGKENSAWDTYVDLAGTYTYANAYTAYLASRADTTPTIPVYGQEMSYEDEKNTTQTTPFTTNKALRMFSWQAATCGARGAFFGQHHVWQFDGGQLTEVASVASGQQRYVAQTVTAIPGWETLTYNDLLIVTGRGTRDDTTSANYETDTFATAAVTSDSKHAIIHFPTYRTSITLDLTQLVGSVKTAVWIDPTNKATTTESNPAAPTQPGNNAGGDPDWILEVTASSGPVALAGSSAGVSSDTGVLAVLRSIAGESDGLATVTALVAVARSIAGESDGLSTVTGAVGVARALAGSSGGVATVGTSTLTLAVGLAATSGGSTSPTATLAVIRGLAGQSNGVATAAASMLNRAVPVAAQSDGVATITAAMNRAVALAGRSDGTSSASANSDTSPVPLAASSAGTSTAAASTVNVARGLSGQSNGATTVSTPLLALARPISGQADGVATVATPMLNVLRALAGRSDGTSTASAVFGPSVALQGQSDGHSSAQGSTLWRLVGLSARSDGVLGAIAVMYTAIRFQGRSDGHAIVVGSMGFLKGDVSIWTGTQWRRQTPDTPPILVWTGSRWTDTGQVWTGTSWSPLNPKPG